MIEIPIADNQDRLDLNLTQIRGFAEYVLRQEAALHADISLAFVNDSFHSYTPARQNPRQGPKWECGL